VLRLTKLSRSPKGGRFFWGGLRGRSADLVEFDSIAIIVYAWWMGTAITVRNLDETVKQKLRQQAARHGRSMEAEVRDILARDVMGPGDSTATTPLPNGVPEPRSGRFDHLIGIWKGRMTTDEVMQITRGE